MLTWKIIEVNFLKKFLQYFAAANNNWKINDLPKEKQGKTPFNFKFNFYLKPQNKFQLLIPGSFPIFIRSWYLGGYHDIYLCQV